MKALRTLAAVAALATAAVAAPASAAQIMLNSSMVVGVLGTAAGFPGAANAFDQQTGAVGVDSTPWLSGFGGVVVLDLGRAYDFSYFEAFATTADSAFAVIAHNRVEYNGFGSYLIPTGSTRVGGGALVADAGSTLTGQRFASETEGSFRYIAIAFNNGNHRLDEFRLFDGDTPLPGSGAVPEPATWALMIGGFGMAGAALRRRQRPATA